MESLFIVVRTLALSRPKLLKKFERACSPLIMAAGVSVTDNGQLSEFVFVFVFVWLRF